MSTLANLQAFDQLAEQAIDPAFQTVANDNQTRHPDYIVSPELPSSVFRTRCRLTITNSHPQKCGLTVSLIISEDSRNEAVTVEECDPTNQDGKPRVVATLKWAEVTREHIERLARNFVDDFFRQVQ